MKRISVVGNSGSGKSTFARSLASGLDIPYVELDSIFHLPGWAELPLGQFRARAAAAAEGPAWVIDGNYAAVRDLVWQRAETVVWLDPPQRLVMARLIRRTLRRVITRAELWNGNREPWSNLWCRDPNRSIIAWAWTQRGEYRSRYESAMADPAWAHLRFLRVRTRNEQARLLAELSRA
jgi:adenylate kinase family enzyme